MPSFLYRNLTDIIATNRPIRGDRYDYSTFANTIIVPQFSTLNNPEDPSSPGTNVELHLFLPNFSYVETLYNVPYQIDSRITDSGEPLRYIVLPIHNHIKQLNLVAGPYKFVYNFFRNLIGSAQSENRLFVSDISSDRREIRLTLTNPTDLESIENLSNFVLQYMRGSKYKLPIILVSTEEGYNLYKKQGFVDADYTKITKYDTHKYLSWFRPCGDTIGKYLMIYNVNKSRKSRKSRKKSRV